MAQPALVTTELTQRGEKRPSLTVTLSHELVTLLSDQLYQSPIKAIEELVVNSYDADAQDCRIYLPSTIEPGPTGSMILIYDDGVGMDEEGLRDLWFVGHSNKRRDVIQQARQRKQIGKFGIGKLATYSIANQITYVSCSEGEILVTTLDYTSFVSSPTGETQPVTLPVINIETDDLRSVPGIVDKLKTAGVDVESLDDNPSWTLVILENLKKKATKIRRGRLRWVLSTAMPLQPDFSLYLNGSPVESSKADYELQVEFRLSELPADRLKTLNDKWASHWRSTGDRLASDSFPNGVAGTVIVTRRSLYGGKSADLERSHGFFVRVRERLVNYEDALFGLKPLAYSVFNRFRADIKSDDLDVAVTAPREGVEDSELIEEFRDLLTELYYEARARFEKVRREEEDKEKTKKEHERNYVNPRFVEHPVADVLVAAGPDPAHGGTDADDDWFYLDIEEGQDLQGVLDALYSEQRTELYSYERKSLGASGRLVQFDPLSATFHMNIDHEFILAHESEDPALLEDFVTAEALLEVYLREEGLPPHITGEVLERRDQLLRSLSRDRVYSLDSVAQELLDTSNDQYDLEIAIVVACRALGFVAKHVSGAGEPDGLARFWDYPSGEQRITLEAKASGAVPTLGSIDFQGIARHVSDQHADGCLLVAPAYPGASKEDDARAAKDARDRKISCWTVEGLARVVRNAAERHINATQILDIVLSAYAPGDVARAIDELLSEPSWNERGLYRAVVRALRELEGRLPDAPRSGPLIAGEVSRMSDFAQVTQKRVERALRDIAGASQGAARFDDGRLAVNTSIDELERRLATLLGTPGQPRKESSFRQRDP